MSISRLAEDQEHSNKSLDQNSNYHSEATSHTRKYNKRHMIIPVKDTDWALNQTPSVHRLWTECWRCDCFGSRWMQLNTKLKRSAFMKAKKTLETQGLFIFKPEKSVADGRETVCWMIKNLHGSSMLSYWKESTQMDSISNIESTQMDSTLNMESIEMDIQSIQVEVQSMPTDIESTQMDSISGESYTQQGFQKPLVSSKNLLSNFLGSNKERIQDARADAHEDLSQENMENVKEVLKQSKPTAKEIELAYTLIVTLYKEPTMHLKAAMLGTKYESSLRRFATTYKWKIPEVS